MEAVNIDKMDNNLDGPASDDCDEDAGVDAGNSSTNCEDAALEPSASSSLMGA